MTADDNQRGGKKSQDGDEPTLSGGLPNRPRSAGEGPSSHKARDPIQDLFDAIQKAREADTRTYKKKNLEDELHSDTPSTEFNKPSNLTFGRLLGFGLAVAFLGFAAGSIYKMGLFQTNTAETIPQGEATPAPKTEIYDAQTKAKPASPPTSEPEQESIFAPVPKKKAVISPSTSPPIVTPAVRRAPIQQRPPKITEGLKSGTAEEDNDPPRNIEDGDFVRPERPGERSNETRQPPDDQGGDVHSDDQEGTVDSADEGDQPPPPPRPPVTDTEADEVPGTFESEQ